MVRSVSKTIHFAPGCRTAHRSEPGAGLVSESWELVTWTSWPPVPPVVAAPKPTGGASGATPVVPRALRGDRSTGLTAVVVSPGIPGDTCSPIAVAGAVKDSGRMIATAAVRRGQGRAQRSVSS